MTELVDKECARELGLAGLDGPEAAAMVWYSCSALRQGCSAGSGPLLWSPGGGSCSASPVRTQCAAAGASVCGGRGCWAGGC